MPKTGKFATLSLLAFLMAACESVPAAGPAMLLKADRPTSGVLNGNLDESGQTVLSYHLGPLSIKANSPATAMLERPEAITFKADSPFWMTKFEPEITDKDGNSLPKELVQEIILINHSEENPLCSTKQTGNPFAAVTSIMNPIELPEDHGYPILPTDTIEARVFLKNNSEQDYNGIIISFTLTGVPMDTAHSMEDVKPLMLDIDPCEHKPVNIPPDQFVEKSFVGFAPENGSIIKVYGLLQDYGVAISIAVGEEDPFWKGNAEIDENYKIINLPPFEDPAGIAVEGGSKLVLTVSYDNATDSWYDNAQGAAIVYLATGGEKLNATTANEKLF